MLKIDWSRVVKPLVGVALLGIFGVFLHNGLSGDHGLGRLHEAEVLEAELEAELGAAREARAALQNKVERLSEDSLDLDLLDEQARRVLGRTRPDEVVIR